MIYLNNNPEFLASRNQRLGTDYKSWQEMLTALFRQYSGVYNRIATELDVSPTAIGRHAAKFGLKKTGRESVNTKAAKIPVEEMREMTTAELAGKLGCTNNYARRLKRQIVDGSETYSGEKFAEKMPEFNWSRTQAPCAECPIGRENKMDRYVCEIRCNLRYEWCRITSMVA